MLNKIIFSILLLFTINCGTIHGFISSVESTPPERQFTPSDTIGCSQFKGRDRINCINNMLQDLQDIKNAKVVKKELSSERYDDMYMKVTSEYCLKSICFTEIEYVYKPTMWGLIKSRGFFTVVGFALGLFLGVQI